MPSLALTVPIHIPVRLETFSHQSSLPLVVRPVDDVRPDVIKAFLEAGLESYLPIHGGILFRGFTVHSTDQFESIAKAVSQCLLDYEFGSTPRSQVSGKVYTSTEYPGHQSIPLHNEQSYTREWPMKIWFYAVQVARHGGETPIADSREVYQRIPQAIRQRFIDRNVMYVRNYGNGLDVPWEQVFQTSSRLEVEAYCQQTNIECEWKADGSLRTRQICQAVATHPQTGDSVWFNQAHLFHISNLDPHVLDALLIAVSEDDLPRNAYYGDGSSIAQEDLEQIRTAYRRVEVRFPWQQGDVLLLDNMLAAHGRAPYEGDRTVLVAMAEAYGEKS